MTDRITIELPEGVDRDHPDVQRMLRVIEDIKPLPRTTRERLATSLVETYDRALDAKKDRNCIYLAEADAAIAFFGQLIRDADDEVRSGHPVSRDGYLRNAAVTTIVQNVLDRLSS